MPRRRARDVRSVRVSVRSQSGQPSTLRPRGDGGRTARALAGPLRTAVARRALGARRDRGRAPSGRGRRSGIVGRRPRFRFRTRATRRHGTRRSQRIVETRRSRSSACGTIRDLHRSVGRIDLGTALAFRTTHRLRPTTRRSGSDRDDGCQRRARLGSLSPGACCAGSDRVTRRPDSRRRTTSCSVQRPFATLARAARRRRP